MLAQTRLIDRIREICQADDRLLAAMMYGSFAKGKGDPYADIEFALFFAGDTVDGIDQRAWLNQIAPVELFYINEFGLTAVVFEGLIRGEFHFYRHADVSMVAGWDRTDAFPSLAHTLIVDKMGALTPHLQTLVKDGRELVLSAEDVQFCLDSFVNWLIFGVNLLQRGDYAHALNELWMVQRYLLSLVRIQAGALTNLPSPTKNLAGDLAPAQYARYVTCTSDLDPAGLTAAYRACLAWVQDLLPALTGSYAINPHGDLLAQIKALLAEVG